MQSKWLLPGMLAACCVAALRTEANETNEKVAAVVNGHRILEKEVQRALRPVPDEHKSKARKEILEFLVNNALVDMYLTQQKSPAPQAEIDKRLKQVEEEITAQGGKIEEFLERIMLTRNELREEVAADLRWQNFVDKHAGDAALRQLFKERRHWFDESQVGASHILIAVEPSAGQEIHQAAIRKLETLKGKIETGAANELKSLGSASGSNPEERVKIYIKHFGQAAGEHSDCPSKDKGGDLGVFPRIGTMVEPFAVAAFSLQPGQMSNVVKTKFGYHLILVTARVPGKAIRYEDVKQEIRETYAEKMRDHLVGQLRQQAKIEIMPVGSP